MGKFTEKDKPSFLKDLLPDEQAQTQTQAPTHTQTHKAVPTPKVRYDRRVQLLMSKDQVEALDRFISPYADNFSRNEVIRKMVDDLLADPEKQKEMASALLGYDV